MPAAKPERKTPWIRKDPHTAYKFGPEVGRGQYGITSLVTENASGTTYACKVISKHQRGFSLAYVRDEVLALERVDDHLNIVSLHEVWETDNDVYIFMEACMGGELFDVIISRGQISESDAAVVAAVILQVVEHCHARGVIHRDLKPENFLLKRRFRKGKLVLSEDNLRAVDFGLAAFLVPGKRFKDLVGSAFYVAPEVLKGSYGREADLWSTGIILYILLCGLPPFHGATEKQIFHDIQHAPIDFETDPWPHVSTPAKDLVQWLLQRDPAKRPSAEQALEHAWLAHPPEYHPHIPSSTIVQRLADFMRMTRLQGLLMHVVAHQLSKAEVDNLHDIFDEMDKDGNGSISIEELREGLTAVMGPDAHPEAADDIMAALDVSGDGEINYSEFIAAVCDHQRMLADHTLAGIFAYMDKNGDGIISADEVSSALGESGLSVGSQSLEDLIAADVPGSKCLTFDDFRTLMLGGLKEEAVQYSQLESALRSMRQREQVRAVGLGCASRLAAAVLLPRVELLEESVNSRFKRLVLLVIARAMPPGEQAGLKRLFERLDLDASGCLSLSELRAGLLYINKQLSEQDIFELMHFMDVDASGEIDFDEFCMGVMDEKALLTPAKLQVAFNYFDKNDDGRIDVAELQAALQHMRLQSASNATDLLRDAAGEQSSEGLDFEAFRRMMMAVDHSILPQLPAARQSSPGEPQQASSSATSSLHAPSLHSCDSRDSSPDRGSSPDATTPADPSARLELEPGASSEATQGRSLAARTRSLIQSHPVSLSSQGSATVDSPLAAGSKLDRLHQPSPCSTSEITPLHDGPQVPAFMRRGSKASPARSEGQLGHAQSAKARPLANGHTHPGSSANGSPDWGRSPSPESSVFSSTGVSHLSVEEHRMLEVVQSIDDGWMRSFLL